MNTAAFTFPGTVTFNTKTPAEWAVETYIPLKGELIFSQEIISGNNVIRAKMGNGVDLWTELPYWNTSIDNNYRPAKMIDINDFEPLSDGTEYVNSDWAGLEFVVFNQNANRYFYPEEITINPSGGFTLAPENRIYENQLLIVTF